MKPKNYIRELGEDLDSKKKSKKFKKLLTEDATDLLNEMGRPDEPVTEPNLARAIEMMRRKWESIAAKCGRTLDENVWDSFKESFLKLHSQ